jgi:tetratricopeptide (TPR) repeat protein
MHLERAAGAATLSCFLFGLPVPVEANRESTALCIRAARETYNLDRDQALATYRQAIAADPQDARAYRGLASALWLSITFRRGSMTVDDYMGRSGRPAGLPVPPPPEAAAAFNDALERALAIARLQVQANPMNPDAHYQLGAAVGLRASYIATVEHSTRRAFRAAREAYDEHEKVLALDAGRKDAGLIVGTYRYIVSTLALPLRWAAYVAGFGGDKARGIRLIEEAAAYGGDNQEDARFGLARDRRDVAPRRTARRRRTLPQRGPDQIRRRPTPAHVRRGRALVLQTWDGTPRTRARRRRGSGLHQGAIRRGTELGPRTRAPRARQARAQGRASPRSPAAS